MSKQFLKFALVGTLATLTTFSVLILLVEVMHQGAVFSSIAGYILGAGVNYALNYRFTFDSSQRHQVAVPRFVTVTAVGLVLNTLVMYFAVNLVALHYILAQLLAVSIVLVWSFTTNRLWTFKETS